MRLSKASLIAFTSVSAKELLKTGANLLGTELVLPKEADWTGNWWKFSSVHLGIKSTPRPETCYLEDEGTRCYREARRELWVAKPQRSHYNLSDDYFLKTSTAVFWPLRMPSIPVDKINLFQVGKIHDPKELEECETKPRVTHGLSKNPSIPFHSHIYIQFHFQVFDMNPNGMFKAKNHTAKFAIKLHRGECDMLHWDMSPFMADAFF